MNRALIHHRVDSRHIHSISFFYNLFFFSLLFTRCLSSCFFFFFLLFYTFSCIFVSVRSTIHDYSIMYELRFLCYANFFTIFFAFSWLTFQISHTHTTILRIYAENVHQKATLWKIGKFSLLFLFLWVSFSLGFFGE